MISCSGDIEYIETTIFALDTVISLKISGNDKNILSECENMINGYENVFSRTKPDSDLSKFYEYGLTPSEDLTATVGWAIEIADITDGCFNPALGTVTELWKDSVPENIDLSHIDYKNLSLDGLFLYNSDPELKLDLGGIAKGYIAQKITDYLIYSGVEYGILSFGGNISAFGNRPDGNKWTIGIRNPYDIDKTIGNLSIDSGYVSVSGDYQRYFIEDGKRYHHIIDPKTGYPVDNGVNSVVVWSESGMLADSLSTALFVMGVEEGMKIYEAGIYNIKFEVMFIADGELIMSDGFRENFKENIT